MSVPEEIIRIAAKGDGVTASGRHIAGAVPGDVLRADGTIQHGPHHATPPCRHFARCGGCQLQHADEEALRRFVTDRVVHAAASQDIAPGEVLPTHLSPSQSRRRATLHGLKTAAGVVLGYREAGSHRIVDIGECPVLRPELFSLVLPLRKALAEAAGKRPVDVALTLADQGVDVAISGLELDGLGPTEAMLDFARDHQLARLSLDQGYGAEPMWEPEPVTVTLSGVPVPLPVGAFLQATVDGERTLVADAVAFANGAGSIADLFSGLGTFAFAFSPDTNVLAVEAAQDAHLASKAVANRHGSSIAALHRDLFRAPLQPDELTRFDAVLLDPPRAGAREQIREIAASPVERVIYVSCNPSSWARDARTLVDAGFRLEKLRPVGQFRWSTHVELTSLFVR
ncbi:class I SAM-dependent RNA methyltransferase [Qipengyuania sp. MTN3-11]|uniref:class I SAM-dependent RNA methyltransferase n=1 Tax=Qipengyuania sp. MTN3-11 TaxID=3056557 RepID=UPI0036F2EF3B